MPDTASNRPRYLARTNARGDRYAYTRVDGRMVSLGRYGTDESYEQYERVVAEWEAAEAERAVLDRQHLTVAELGEKYLEHELARADAGLIDRQTYRAARYAAEAMIADHAGMPVARFGPRSLKAIQRRLVVTPCRVTAGRHAGDDAPPNLSRAEINRRVNGIRRMFRWAVSEELVPAAVLASLEAVSGLRAGEARDNPPRTAVEPETVRATIGRLRADGHHGLAGVLELIRWTGCRPDEVCGLIAGDVVQTRDGLELRIRDHKTRKTTEADRVVPLNARAAEIVSEALDAGLNIDRSRRLFLSANGKAIRSNGLFQAVRRAAEAAGVPHWTAYQLRHLAATEMLDAGCTEVEAAAMLGHTPNSMVVRRYSRDRTRLARRAAAGIGSREAG